MVLNKQWPLAVNQNTNTIGKKRFNLFRWQSRSWLLDLQNSFSCILAFCIMYWFVAQLTRKAGTKIFALRNKMGPNFCHTGSHLRCNFGQHALLPRKKIWEKTSKKSNHLVRIVSRFEPRYFPDFRISISAYFSTLSFQAYSIAGHNTLSFALIWIPSMFTVTIHCYYPLDLALDLGLKIIYKQLQ